MINKENEQYYRNYNELFRTEGWKQLLNELASNANQINSVELTEGEDDLYRRKGQLNVIASLLNFENTITMAQEQAENEEIAEDSDEVVS
jgi:hypothetical protein